MHDSTTVPPDLAALKTRQMDATTRLYDLAPDAPDEERAAQREAERTAVMALLSHPAYGQTHWRALYDAATGTADD